MRKLKRSEAKLIKDIVHQNHTVIEIDNKRYFLSLVEEPEPMKQPSKTNTKLAQKYVQTKLDILRGRNFSIDDVVEMMDNGVL
ncbi:MULTISPECIES: hypothetical protein [unclassified Virgibacillus]|uniref:hypothetical protein n=1 Tax=unclassified Virgibacillus TaxID=2620237 RepID=UPI0024DEDFF6|nr:hypothetical protein [Virgibacillus sp. LDC-1]